MPDTVPDEAAVFAEPLAAALHVCDAVEDAAGGAIVLGDGKLGLLVAQALAAAGVPTLVVGHHREKLALAAAAGAETALESELGARPRSPLVVEATGSAAGLERAFALARPRGIVVQKTTVSGKLSVDFAPVVIDELRIVGSRCGDMARALECLAAGRIDPRPLLAARYPLARADEALRHAARPGTLKVVVEGVA